MAEIDQGYSGSATMEDGTRVMFTPEQAEALWKASEAAQAKAEADFPDVATALREMSRAFHRLKDFGWREAIYCPKDGSEFEVIEAGSTGIHRCHSDGKWPTGHWWILADGDLWPSRPILFRLLPEAQAEYDRKMAEAAARFAASREEG